MVPWWKALPVLAPALSPALTSVLTSVLTLALVSCVATEPVPETRRLPLAGEPLYKKPRDLPAAAPGASAAARSLERGLVETDAGAILLRALRAAGGWDAWLALGDARVITTVAPPEGSSQTRSEQARNEQTGNEQTGNEQARIAQVADAIISPSGALSVQPVEAAAPGFLALLPFSLGDAAVRLEYLGVEVDHATAEYAEKIRCVRPGAPDGEWHIVAFDRRTWAVRRIVSREASGAMSLRVASEPVEMRGVRLLGRRVVYPLKSVFAHVDFEKPQAVETVRVATGE